MYEIRTSDLCPQSERMVIVAPIASEIEEQKKISVGAQLHLGRSFLVFKFISGWAPPRTLV